MWMIRPIGAYLYSGITVRLPADAEPMSEMNDIGNCMVWFTHKNALKLHANAYLCIYLIYLEVYLLNI